MMRQYIAPRSAFLAVRTGTTQPISRTFRITAQRHTSNDNRNDDIDMPDKSRIPFLSILDALGSGRRASSPRHDSRRPALQLSKDAFPAVPRKIPKDSGPFVTYIGRTKTVENGNLGAAFRSLNSVLKQNKVAKEFKDQKFHEKPSNKRVRLASQRHRRRFLLGVKRLVNLVKEQRKYL